MFETLMWALESQVYMRAEFLAVAPGKFPCSFRSAPARPTAVLRHLLFFVSGAARAPSPAQAERWLSRRGS